MSTETNLGDLIKSAMRAEKITQDDLASKMGVSRQTINTHLSKSRIDKDFLLELKKHTGIDYTNFYDKSPITQNHGLAHPKKWEKLLTLPLELLKGKDVTPEDTKTISEYMAQLSEAQREFEELERKLDELENKKRTGGRKEND